MSEIIDKNVIINKYEKHYYIIGIKFTSSLLVYISYRSTRELFHFSLRIF